MLKNLILKPDKFVATWFALFLSIACLIFFAIVFKMDYLIHFLIALPLAVIIGHFGAKQTENHWKHNGISFHPETNPKQNNKNPKSASAGVAAVLVFIAYRSLSRRGLLPHPMIEIIISEIGFIQFAYMTALSYSTEIRLLTNQENLEI